MPANPALHSWTPTRYEREIEIGSQVYALEVQFAGSHWYATARHVNGFGVTVILNGHTCETVLDATAIAERACKIDADTRNMKG
jgi:hypothetical protein